MDDAYQINLLTIQNKKGLHARAAATFVKEVEKYDAEIFVEKEGVRVSGNSIMGLMMLAAAKGTKIKVLTTGQEAKEAMDGLTDLVNHKFGEDE